MFPWYMFGSREVKEKEKRKKKKNVCLEKNEKKKMCYLL